MESTAPYKNIKEGERDINNSTLHPFTQDSHLSSQTPSHIIKIPPNRSPLFPQVPIISRSITSNIFANTAFHYYYIIMSDKGFMSKMRNMFGGKKVEPVTQHPSTAPRTVNFGVATSSAESKTINFKAETKDKAEPGKQQRDQFEDLSKDIPEEPFIDTDERYDRIDSKLTLKELQLPNDDILPGEVIVVYEKKIVECKLKKNHYAPGEFILTNYKFIFRPSVETYFDRSDYFKVPLGMIDKLERKNDNNKNKEGLPKLIVTLKDAREFKFKLPLIETLKKIAQEMARFSFVEHKREFFAFRYFQHNKELEERNNGWKLYDPVKEFNRMGLFPLDHTEKVQLEWNGDFKYLDNTNGKVCSTYPSLLVVPSRLAYDYIVRCSKFRSRERLPALTYYVEYAPGKKSTLFRCSQTRTGVGKNRCIEDEMMLRLIGDPSHIKDEFKGTINCKVYDARDYIAALGNMISGKGYERVEFYKNCEIEWLNIPNIHAVRDSFNQIRAAALGDQIKFWSGVADSGWYDYVFLILSGARSVASSLLKGINVVVHCSDGWDRTSQLCALAQILIDPYYRTIEGFQVLIEKDWISFGHMFVQRLNQGKNNPGSENKSQVFLQYLDCVSQLLHQFPLSFEFNQSYLIEVLRQAHNHMFGTFLCDSQLQQVRSYVKTKTVSLWSYIQHNKDKFLNPYYQPEWTKHLDVSCAQKNFRLWKEYFLAHVDGFKDVYQIYSCEWTDENPTVIHGKLKKENELLKMKHQENDKVIKELQQQIEEAKRRKNRLAVKETVEIVEVPSDETKGEQKKVEQQKVEEKVEENQEKVQDQEQDQNQDQEDESAQKEDPKEDQRLE